MKHSANILLSKRQISRAFIAVPVVRLRTAWHKPLRGKQPIPQSSDAHVAGANTTSECSQNSIPPVGATGDNTEAHEQHARTYLSFSTECFFPVAPQQRAYPCSAQSFGGTKHINKGTRGAKGVLCRRSFFQQRNAGRMVWI